MGVPEALNELKNDIDSFTELYNNLKKENEELKKKNDELNKEIANLQRQLRIINDDYIREQEKEYGDYHCMGY